MLQAVRRRNVHTTSRSSRRWRRSWPACSLRPAPRGPASRRRCAGARLSRRRAPRSGTRAERPIAPCSRPARLRPSAGPRKGAGVLILINGRNVFFYTYMVQELHGPDHPHLNFILENVNGALHLNFFKKVYGLYGSYVSFVKMYTISQCYIMFVQETHGPHSPYMKLI